MYVTSTLGDAGAGPVPIPLWQQGLGKAGEVACRGKSWLVRHSTEGWIARSFYSNRHTP